MYPYETYLDIEHFLFAIQCNAHRIVSENIPIGLGLFPLTSMMNHSCSPNCAQYFIIEPGKPVRLIMRAIRAIAEGEELTYSYVALYEPTNLRQTKLQAAYGFNCTCERCCGQGSCLFPDDTFLDSPGSTASEKSLTEISTCDSILMQDPSRAPIIYKKIISILGTPGKLAGINPCDKKLLIAYSSLVRAGAEYFLTCSNEIEAKIICQHVIYFGLLYTGLIAIFTRTRSLEISSILLLVVTTLKHAGKRNLSIFSSNLEISFSLEKNLFSTDEISFSLKSSSSLEDAINFIINEIKLYGSDEGECFHQHIASYCLETVAICRGEDDKNSIYSKYQKILNDDY